MVRAIYLTCNADVTLLLTVKVSLMATARKKSPKALDQSQEWLSLVAAAAALGESRFRVLQRAVKGEITARHVAGRTVVSRVSVERVLATRAS